MSDNTQENSPRRLMQIDADEVSLVDRPAIQRKFLIVKRQEDGMSQVAKMKPGEEEEDMEKSATPAAEEVEQSDKPDAPPQKSEEEEDDAEKMEDSEEEESDQSEGEPEPEKAEGDYKKHLMPLLPWLKAQAGESEGELKGHLEALVDFLAPQKSEDGAEEAEDADEAEKAEAVPAFFTDAMAQISALSQSVQQLNAAVAKSADGEEEDAAAAETAEGDASAEAAGFVTQEQFNAYNKQVMDTTTNMQNMLVGVSKSLDGAIPPSKAADDTSSTTAQVEKSEKNVFEGLFKV